MHEWVAVVAALPREVRGLVGPARPERALRQEGVLLYQLPGVVVVAAGMGPERATRALAAVQQAAAGAEAQLVEVLSVGLAGACSAALRPGEIAEASQVIDAHTGERYRTAADPGGPILATTATIAAVHEKARLAATYNAALVDMEAATLARLSEAHGLRFRALKGISDAHDFELASLARFSGKRGQFRTAAFALHTALRPPHWRPAAQLGRHSSQALSALWHRLRLSVLEPGAARTAGASKALR